MSLESEATAQGYCYDGLVQLYAMDNCSTLRFQVPDDDYTSVECVFDGKKFSSSGIDSRTMKDIAYETGGFEKSRKYADMKKEVLRKINAHIAGKFPL